MRWEVFLSIANTCIIMSQCRETVPNQPSNACRLHGKLQLTKVAGNFHVTAGKVLPLPMRAHAHLSPMIDDERFNYSHRIDKFSFGQSSSLVQPLEGDEVISDKGIVTLFTLTPIQINPFLYRCHVIPIFRDGRSDGNRIACFRLIRNPWVTKNVAIFSTKPIKGCWSWKRVPRDSRNLFQVRILKEFLSPSQSDFFEST